MNRLNLLIGDCRETLKTLPDESVHCCVTSPPYWGLRDYGTATWSGGLPECDHANKHGSQGETGQRAGRTFTGAQNFYKEECLKCGAKRIDAQLGLEKTPELYVANMVAVFREVRRVLRKDGTLWLNLGSSYASSGGERTYGSSDGGVGRGPGTTRYKAPSASRGNAATQSLRPQNDPACGTDGKAPQDSTVPDSSCSDLCDGCRAAFSTDTARTYQPIGQCEQPAATIGHDSARSDSSEATPDASLPSDLESTTPLFSEQPQEGCHHCGNCGACLSVLRSSSRDSRLCVRRAECIDGTSWRGSEFHNLDKDALGLAWAYSSIPSLNFKPKDLIPIPWLVAMALQADGWYLRQWMPWVKRNAMPESVQDRPSTSCETFFLLTKTSTYFYDAEAVKMEASKGSAGSRFDKGKTGTNGNGRVQQGEREESSGRSRRNGDWFLDSDWQGMQTDEEGWPVAMIVNPQPYADAHFATFPPKLVQPCILAGTSAKGCCPACGAPWERIMDAGEPDLDHQKACGSDENGAYDGQSTKDYLAGGAQDASATKARILAGMKKRRTIDWTPTCTCGREDTVPCLVLDPFLGSGTTAKVAIENGRHAIGNELNPEYGKLIEQRTNVTPGLAF